MALLAEMLSPQELQTIRSGVWRWKVEEEKAKALEEAKSIILAFLHADIQEPQAREAVARAREFLARYTGEPVSGNTKEENQGRASES